MVKFFGVKTQVEPDPETDHGPLDHIKKLKSETPRSDGKPKILANVANILGRKPKPQQKKKGNAAKRLQSKIKNDRRLKQVTLRSFKSYRDKAWLAVIAGILLFMLILIIYSQMAPEPEQHLCTRADCICSQLEGDALTETCPEIGSFAPHDTPLRGVSYYYIKPAKNNNSMCWAVPDPLVSENIMIVDYQPIYDDFNVFDECIVEESLYYVLTVTNAFFWYFYVVAVMGLVSLAVMSGAFFYPQRMILAVHAFAALCLWGVFIASCALLSAWAFIWLFLAFNHLIYILLVKDKLPELNTIMVSIMSLLKKQKGILVVSSVAGLLQASIFMLWGYVWVFLNGRLTGFVDFFWFLALCWLSQVVKYMSHATIAGSVASWYFGKDDLKFPTLRSMIRACTTSFGSIIYGSTFMFLFKVVRVMSSFLRISSNIVAVLCGGCLICFEGIMRQFNIYGFVLVAVYGMDYSAASAKSYQLITDHGMRGMMLDDIVAVTVFVAGAGVGAIGFAACWAAVQLGLVPGYEDYDFTVTLYLPSFFLGLLMGVVIVEAVESVLVTIYTCFAEEPGMLEETDKGLYDELKDQWYAGMEDSDEDEDYDPENPEEDDEDQFSVSDGLSDDLERRFSDFDEDQGGPQIAMQVMQTTVAKLEASKKDVKQVKQDEDQGDDNPKLLLPSMASSSTDPYAPESGANEEGLASIGILQRFQSIPAPKSEQLKQISEH